LKRGKFAVEDKYLDRLVALDERIVAASRDVKVLSKLSWPAEAQSDFLKGLESGKLSLPAPEYARTDLAANRDVLKTCIAELEGEPGPDGEPLRRYLLDTAQSYYTLCRLVDAIGTPEMMEHSRALYGTPTDLISSGHVNNLEAARHFLEVSQQYRQATGLQDSDYCLSAELLAAEMKPLLDEVFGADLVRVEIDSRLASKATAGATRIRLRTGTCFSEYDLGQLLQHEGFVHSLTAINGQRQSKIRSLSLGSPRTTGAQEGLATFAELVTGVMDINRLERLALRVIGIDHALNGADFIEVFRFFLDAGQGELESFNSTMRIFRGVPVTGGAAFTKDVVYLHGLMEVHTFFRWAMQHKKLDMCRNLFAGRMTIGDLVRMEGLFADGTLDPPQFLPPWMERTNGLAGYLAFSVFANRITVEELDEHHAFETMADMGI